VLLHDCGSVLFTAVGGTIRPSVGDWDEYAPIMVADGLDFVRHNFASILNVTAVIVANDNFVWTNSSFRKLVMVIHLCWCRASAHDLATIFITLNRMASLWVDMVGDTVAAVLRSCIRRMG